MGIFSSKKIISVASVPYNLAGDRLDRKNYLRTTVAQAVLFSDSDTSLGEAIVAGQLGGPGIDQRRFYSWATNNYPEGAVTGDISNRFDIQPADILSHLTVPAGYTAEINGAFVDDADINYLAEKHIMDTRPEDFDTAWVADYNEFTNTLTITYADTSTENIVRSFDPTKEFIICYYAVVRDDFRTSVVTGTVTESATPPDTTGWLQTSRVDRTINPVTLTETVEETVDDSANPPPVVTNSSTDTNTTFDEYDEVWTKTTFQGSEPGTGRLRYLEEEMYVWKKYRIVSTEETVVETVGTVTTTTVTTTESIETYYEVRVDENFLYSGEAEGRMLLYEVGTGNTALDALVAPSVAAGNIAQGTQGEFFPFIPLRLANQSISTDPNYDTYRKAYRKATGQRLSSILDEIEANPDIGDIDHAFFVHGVELNTNDDDAKRYLYEFFKNLTAYQNETLATVDSWKTYMDAYAVELAAWEDWVAVYGSTFDESGTVEEPPPDVRSTYYPEVSTLRVHAPQRPEYDMRLSWFAIGESTHVGLGKTGARRGDLWFEKKPAITFQRIEAKLSLTGRAQVSTDTIPVCELFWQDETNAYRKLTIYGLTHTNFVYEGKTVVITSDEALDDVDETGFIIPLHQPTLKELPLTIATQVSTENRMIVFNCYEVVKQRWYQRGIFKVVFAVVAGAVMAVFFPAGLGLLGSNIAVGSALGFSGVTAAMIGGAVNALAALALLTAVETFTVAAFGEKWGQIIAVVVSALVFNAAQNFFSGQNAPVFNWGDMMKADNLLKLTDTIGKGVQAWAQGETAEIQAEMRDAAKQYQNDMDALKAKAQELLGTSGAYIDPLWFTQAGSPDFNAESAETFLSRTTMTGSDIVELSLRMITDFVEMTIALPEPKV